jgi:adenylate kinase family enzyme
MHTYIRRGKTSGRGDDNAESIAKRFKTYEESTRPIIDYFRSAGRIKTVDSNRDPDVVYMDAAQHFE